MPEFDLIILGAGPAGISAGIYASRKQLKTLLVTKEMGGQSIVSEEIQNWVGTPSISGADLAKSMKTHLETYANDILTIKEGLLAKGINKVEDGFLVTLSDDSQVNAKAVLIATGSSRRHLEVPGAAEFENKGLTYCASCDGPLFSGQDVAVIGGGNAGFETAAQLLAYAKSVTLLHRGDTFKADPITVEKVLAHSNMTGILNADTTKILGDKFVSGLEYKDATSDESKKLDVTGVFVEIGMLPNTDFVGDIVPTDEYKRINIDPWTQKTETDGIWAAGDCTNVKYHQNNISAGDGVRALEDIYVTLKAR